MGGMQGLCLHGKIYMILIKDNASLSKLRNMSFFEI